MKMAVLWVVAPCGLVEVSELFAAFMIRAISDKVLFEVHVK
jgi:hypothetical protein